MFLVPLLAVVSGLAPPSETLHAPDDVVRWGDGPGGQAVDPQAIYRKIYFPVETTIAGRVPPLSPRPVDDLSIGSVDAVGLIASEDERTRANAAALV